ncbi:MAG: hypothetical protein QOD92_452 [Acidimicrobiaceae bacterium]
MAAGTPPRRGFIRAFGLFWAADEIIWTPGAGNKNVYRILGRHGLFRPKLQICDFRRQRGIYVLYDDYGPYYVGLARDQDIGNRLRHHTRDFHMGKWDRFSWFGFRPVLKGREPDGTRKLGAVPNRLLTQSRSTIADIEALMIQSLGTQKRGNAQEMRFAAAQKWEQVMRHEVDEYLDKVGR